MMHVAYAKNAVFFFFFLSRNQRFESSDTKNYSLLIQLNLNWHCKKRHCRQKKANHQTFTFENFIFISRMRFTLLQKLLTQWPHLFAFEHSRNNLQLRERNKNTQLTLCVLFSLTFVYVFIFANKWNFAYHCVMIAASYGVAYLIKMKN